MSQGHVPGPCNIFLGTGASAAYEFLGYSQDGVNMNIIGYEENVMCDVTGPSVPIDVQFMGEDAYISLTLNKYNEAILQKAAARRLGASVVPGAVESNGLGSLMIAENYAYKILLLFPYRTKAFQSSVMVPCYEFAAGWLFGEFSVPLSIRVKAPRITFRCIPVANSTNLSSILYSNTLPGTVPTPN